MRRTTGPAILRAFAATERSLGVLSAVVVLVMMLAITANVVSRALFNAPIGGIYEIAQLLMVALVFFGAAYVQAEKAHISVTFVHERLPAAGQRLCSAVVLLISIAFWAVITYQMSLGAIESWRIGEYAHGAVRFPVYPTRTVIPIGTGLLTIRLAIDFLSVVRDATGKPARAD